MVTKINRCRLRRLSGNTDGVALVEMALAAPFLILLIMGLIDMALYGAALVKAQQAVNRGLEMSMMGGPSLSSDEIRDQAAAQAGVSTNNVAVVQTLECSGTATSWDVACAADEETARYTQIQVSTAYRPSFALAWLGTDSDRNIPISTTGVVRIQ